MSSRSPIPATGPARGARRPVEAQLVQWLEVDEVLALLKISRRMLYELVQTGKLGCYRPTTGSGKRATMRFDAAEIARYQQACFQPARR